MTGIDISKIKPGDEVTVSFVVNEVDAVGWKHVECRPGDLDGGVVEDDYISVGVKRIVAHIPKALAVGDVAIFLPLERRVSIIAISGDRAWVGRLDSGGSDYICDLRSLDRVS